VHIARYVVPAGAGAPQTDPVPSAFGQTVASTHAASQAGIASGGKFGGVPLAGMGQRAELKSGEGVCSQSIKS
jgi:hypothetical protein